MAVDSAISKATTYAEIEDQVRNETMTEKEDRLLPAMFLKRISLGVQKIAGVLKETRHPAYKHYLTTTQSDNVITGSANPYSLDLSAVTPVIDEIDRVVHITAGGVRTDVQILPPREAENIITFTNYHASSIFAIFEGDALRFYKGASFTITIASDDVEIKYYRVPITASVTRASNIDLPDQFTGALIEDVSKWVIQWRNNGKSAL